MYRYSEMDVGEGWRPIVKQAIQEIEQLGGKITQIKEKFGGLRIYYWTDSNHVEINAIVQNAENACSKICERCGKPGELHDLDGWLKTVCDQHNPPILLNHENNA